MRVLRDLLRPAALLGAVALLALLGIALDLGAFGPIPSALQAPFAGPDPGLVLALLAGGALLLWGRDAACAWKRGPFALGLLGCGVLAAGFQLLGDELAPAMPLPPDARSTLPFIALLGALPLLLGFEAQRHAARTPGARWAPLAPYAGPAAALVLVVAGYLVLRPLLAGRFWFLPPWEWLLGLGLAWGLARRWLRVQKAKSPLLPTRSAASRHAQRIAPLPDPRHSAVTEAIAAYVERGDGEAYARVLGAAPRAEPALPLSPLRRRRALAEQRARRLAAHQQQLQALGLRSDDTLQET